MDNNQYLIPANSKKSMLILSFFNPTDLIIFVTGAVLTFILLMAMKANTFGKAVIIMVPLLIAAFLIMPVPNHHNMRTFIKNVYNYYISRRTYYWRGWCIHHGDK